MNMVIKNKSKILVLFIIILSLLFISSCDEKEKEEEIIDYVATTKLEQSFSSSTSFLGADGIEEVTLYQAVDGDTIHVLDKTGTILKLRFLGVDTPESTSRVEPWGMAASKFTKNIVKTCNKIVIQSEGGPATTDNYGRYLTWVWYQTEEGADFRLLNLELVQNGYSFGKSDGLVRYKDVIIDAAALARNQGLKVFGETDPDYCYNEAIELSLKELRTNLDEFGNESEYYNKKVIFEATVVGLDRNGTYYFNDTDLETGIVYGIQAYSNQAGTTGYLDEIGNRVKISGTVVYYETGGVYQLTSLVDRVISSNKNNIKLIQKNYEYDLNDITPDELADKTDNNKLFTIVKINNLVVKSTYTTKTEGSSSKGAITITGLVDNKTVTVRTIVLYDREGTYLVDSNKIVLESNFTDKTIDVVGIVELYEDNYQIKLLSMDNVTFH